MEHDPCLKEILLEIVFNQLRLNDPPETRQTPDRLVSEGYSNEGAIELIGTVVTTHIYEMLTKEHSFELAQFIEALEKLPAMPWADGD